MLNRNSHTSMALLQKTANLRFLRNLATNTLKTKHIDNQHFLKTSKNTTKKSLNFFEKSCFKIWMSQKNRVPLHRI